MTKLLLGTYTRGKSDGMYTIELNEETHKLENLQLVAETESPTYISYLNNGEVVFSVLSKDDKGGLGSFVKQDENLSLVDSHLQEGAAPCYVAYDKNRSLVYTANYHDGLLQIFKTNDSGRLTLTETISHKGSGPHENQDKAHAHYFDLTPDNQFVVSCDLGTDEVHTYKVDSEGKAEEISKLDVKPGTGPRHLTFHPDGTHAFVFGELSSEMITVKYDKENGSFSVVDTVSTLPEEFTGENSGAALRVSQDGKFLYASNRGHDSIVTFEIKEDYTLNPIDWISTEGKTPRDFNLSKDESFIVTGHQHEDVLTLFERNSENGKLSLLQKDVFAPEVVCIKFLD